MYSIHSKIIVYIHNYYTLKTYIFSKLYHHCLNHIITVTTLVAKPSFAGTVYTEKIPSKPPSNQEKLTNPGYKLSLYTEMDFFVFHILLSRKLVSR